MANSDWPSHIDKPSPQEVRYVYFQPILGQLIEDSWECKCGNSEWRIGASPDTSPIIQDDDLDLFWRVPVESNHVTYQC